MSSETPPPDTAPPGPLTDGAAERKRPEQQASRRRFDDRGGRRRIDWPDDSGLTSCPACGHEHLHSFGVLDSGDYLWQCPQCDRRFQTGRATRTLL